MSHLSLRMDAGAKALLWSLYLCAVSRADEFKANADYFRYFFAFPTNYAIHQADHFGIANGAITAGVNYHAMADIEGLFAPPYVSSDFRFTIVVDGESPQPTSGMWLPERFVAKHALNPLQIDSSITLIHGRRAILLSLLFSPRDGRQSVHLSGKCAGTLDTNSVWEFARPSSKTPTVAKLDRNLLLLEQGGDAIAIMWGGTPGTPEITMNWDVTSNSWSCDIPVNQSGTGQLRFGIAIGSRDEAIASCRNAIGTLDYAVEDAYAARVKALLDRVPRFHCDNRALERLYNRSLVHALMNKWDVPEFKLHPYYSTGSVKGGCVCNYLWDFGEVWEILPLIDPDAVKAHIKQFLSIDLTKHFAFLPITGEGFGPWYMVNQEKIIGLVYYYVMNTGDTGFLNDTVGGRTILDHVLEHATFGDDGGKPVALIDYGESNSHLELRKDLKYNHVMPDLNGRRYNNYVFAAKLSEMMDKPRPDLLERAEALKKVLHDELWNPQAKWFAFKNGKGEKELRYTCQMFKLFNSRVLTDESLQGLLSHWNATEFLGDYGLHSLAKGDPAYDENDVDNGGPGACTCFPPQIMERLYKSGHAAEADELLKRILWWGEKLPYWGDSLYADRPDYRKDTPLQCAIDGLTVAQMMIFGLFGITPHPDGSITINPHLPPLAKEMALHNVKLRGHKFDVTIEDDKFSVREKSSSQRNTVGDPITLTAH